MNNAKRKRQNAALRQDLINEGWKEVRSGLWISTTTGGKHPAGVDGYIWAKHGLHGQPFAVAHIRSGVAVPVNTILSAKELHLCTTI